MTLRGGRLTTWAIAVAAMLPAPAPAGAATFAVRNANDGGPGSLRQAISAANRTTTADTITFLAGSPSTFRPTRPLPAITAPVTVNGASQPGHRLDGRSAGDGASGFVIRAAGSVIQGLRISGFETGAGIRLTGTAASKNLIRGNEIEGNRNGVQLDSGAHHNRIGAPTTPTTPTLGQCELVGQQLTDACNLISGNKDNGVVLTGSGTSYNRVQSNYVGTNFVGDARSFAFFTQRTGVSVLGGARFNTIGGTEGGARNVIGGNSGAGISIAGSGTSNTTVQGNHVGTDAAGTKSIANGVGVAVEPGASATTIGGTTASARNVVSGNTGTGVRSAGATTIVRRNYVGTDATGTRRLGNAVGVTISGRDNEVGGTRTSTSSPGNLVSGNGTGVVVDVGAANTVVQGNDIGTDAGGENALANREDGIRIGAGRTTIGGAATGAGNRIAFNEGSGVTVLAGTGTEMRRNAIFGNEALAVDLVAPAEVITVSSCMVPVPPVRCLVHQQVQGWPTANDARDSDTGPNNLQNHPVLGSVTVAGASTTVKGRLDSAPGTTFTLDFYRSAVPDPLLHGEGDVYVGSASATTNASGDATFAVTFPGAFPGQFYSGTATDPARNTSELGEVAAATPDLAAG